MMTVSPRGKRRKTRRLNINYASPQDWTKADGGYWVFIRGLRKASRCGYSIIEKHCRGIEMPRDRDKEKQYG